MSHSTFPRDIHPDMLAPLFAPRQPDSHKGTHGTLAIIGGASGMSGAALLAGRAAIKSGAGKVLIGFVAPTPPLACDPMQLELMLRTADQLLGDTDNVTAWVAGCGMGTSTDAAEQLRKLFKIRAERPLLIDADGLNLIASGAVPPDWGHGPVIMTPHAGEAGRLLGLDTQAVQADRLGTARALAARFQAWVILKGAGSLICAPNGDCLINRSGNPGLASAGTGDVLAGMLGALLAQQFAPAIAAPGAVWLHGAAADVLAAQGVGPIGLTASELADAARQIRNNVAVAPHHTTSFQQSDFDHC